MSDIRSQIKNICRKHPNWMHLFLNIQTTDPKFNISEMTAVFNEIIKYKESVKDFLTPDQALKISETVESSKIEKIYDYIQYKLSRTRQKQFISSLKTKKYQKLFSAELESLIKECLENGFTEKDLCDGFFCKIAKYKKSSTLLKAFQDFKEKNSNWNIEYYKGKISQLDCEIIEDKENTLMIQVKSYKACKLLGAQAWCIVSQKFMYDNYTKNGHRQFIAYDFNKDISDKESIIGFTLGHTSTVLFSYLKNDQPTPLSITNKYKFKETSAHVQFNLLKKHNYLEAMIKIIELDLLKAYPYYEKKININEAFIVPHSIEFNGLSNSFNNQELMQEYMQIVISITVNKNNYPIDDITKYAHQKLEAQRSTPLIASIIRCRLDLFNKIYNNRQLNVSVYDNAALRYTSLLLFSAEKNDYFKKIINHTSFVASECWVDINIKNEDDKTIINSIIKRKIN